MTARNQWGIATPHGEWEESLLWASRTYPTQASENDTKSAVLLVDAKGAPLIVREPRKVGFRIEEKP